MPELKAHYTADLARDWPNLSRADRALRFQLLSREEADDFFFSLSSREQAHLLLLLPQEEHGDLLRLLPAARRDDVLATLLPDTPENALQVHTHFARLRPEMTVDEALAALRRQTGQVETIYYAYVLDADERLVGVVSFWALFSGAKDRLVRDVMRARVVSLLDTMDHESAVRLFNQHHLPTLPVVDRHGHMRGIFTLHDVFAAAEEQASEDIQKLGGMEALDGPYLQVSMGQMVRKRAGWLAILFVGEMLTATAMGYYEDEIAKAVVLALFLPLIISSGGNSGSQATTLVIRAMAVGELRLRDWWRVIRREILAGFTLGVVLATIGAARILIWQSIRGAYGPHYPLVALTIAVSLIGVVMFGTIAGSMLPFLLRRCGLDPASASAPFVATLVDVTGLVIYFNVARVILRHTLL